MRGSQLATPLVLGLLSLGCGGVGRDAPDCDDVEDFACFRGMFRTLVSEPVEGLEVCPLDLEDIACETTDSQGQWVMPGLPRNSDVTLTAVHTDFTPTVFPQHSSMDWYAWFKVAVPPFVLETHANRLAVDLDPERGHLLFLTWEGLNIDGIDTPNVPGVTAELAGADGEVFYGDALGFASSSATETSNSGAGGALNLLPGTAQLRFEAPAGACAEAMFHWEIDEDGFIPFPIVAGFVTAVDIQCPAAQ